eukprot:m.222448 g.222448  ORF g.222448 m.222448 type:complete len:205 (-) comp16031_c0_seq1:416-1030(-)
MQHFPSHENKDRESSSHTDSANSQQHPSQSYFSHPHACVHKEKIEPTTTTFPIKLAVLSPIFFKVWLLMASKGQAVRPPPNAVHQNAILVETVRKEERHQKLFESYSPQKNVMCVTGKVNVAGDVGGPDLEATTPKKAEKPRPPIPQTSAQEYGWYNSQASGDTASEFHKGRHQTEITNYMDAFWRQKEQASLGGKAAAAAEKK